MAKASPALTNFNAGEISPLLDARVDFEKYPNAASLLENFVPTVQGPLKKRAGTRFAGTSKNNGQCVLIPFEYSVSQAYMVEFGVGYARFYTTDSSTGERGLLLNASGLPVEVATSYTLSHLFNADGSTKLKYAQAGDVLYLCCPGLPVCTLRRTSATGFEFLYYETKNGPFKDLNDSSTTIYANAQSGYVRLTASAPIFHSGMLDTWVYLETPAHAAVKPWISSEPVWPGNLRRSDGKNYISQTNAYTGTVQPVHTEGLEWDGPNVMELNPVHMVGVLWQYSDPGYGSVMIKNVISSYEVEGWVWSKSLLPLHVCGYENRTTRWALGAWDQAQGYPTSVAFFRSRLWFARGQKVWASVVEDFTDFSPQDNSEVTADMAISITLASGQINDIQWLLPDKDLIAGTAAGEFAIGELSNGDALGPNNIRAVLQSEYGSKSIQPVKNGSSILFIQRAGLKAREFYYNIGADGYVSEDAAVVAEHITAGDGVVVSGGRKAFGIVAMALAQEPDPVVWMVRSDRQLIGLTWNNEQKVKGWHRHSVSGEVESVGVIPAFEGDREELWLCVKRMVNGRVCRCIEYMDAMYRSGEDPSEQFYLDCGLSYRGTPTQVVQGLSHLEGCEVAVLADGAVQSNALVRDGAITLASAASVVHVGLPYTATYRSMRIEAAAADGTAQGKTKRINKAVFRLLDTGSGRYGASLDKLDALMFRTPQHAMSKAVPLFSGDKLVEFPGDYGEDGYVVFVSDQPYAATLVGIFPQVTTQDR
ncbi:hypothetical protein CUZ56_01865 [Saezia sanguinis]|uniref:Tail tubular protein B n=1 Tax=Saezia sanguinis TaxID=1965230 RepID=A0A433SCW5_9BURK|nr:hypothetical protein [Saezia sanguinis]RUS66585.1 hypothetical protein CUZ56_01865 [Saezia sanguinis]